MMVLTRRVHEKIRIGDDITVTITKISSKKIRIGIDAPKDISIDREETYQKKRIEAAATAAQEQSCTN